ncbi:MAG: hypothetical protein Q8Q14_01885 [Gemmatimonadales bacterium]|nr:hypothetical protein [Gemmatimonadales bacterium]
MAWNVPTSWTSLIPMTKSRLDEQIYDNLTFLGTHTHSGDPGDGATIVLAGLVEHGASKHSDITRRMDVPLREAVSGVGAAAYTMQGSWGDVTSGWVLRDAVTDGLAFRLFPVPIDWASGAMTPVVAWYGGTGATGDVRLAVSCMVISAGDAEDPLGTDDATQTQDLGASVNLRVSTFASAAVTPTATTEFIRLTVSRAGAHANDTNTTNAIIAAVYFEYTASQ